MSQQDENNTAYATLLAGLPLFQGMARQCVAGLAERLVAKRLEKGELLFRSGDPATGIHVVAHGQIKLYFLSPSGTEMIVSIVNSRQSFGESDMLARLPHPLFAQANADTLTLMLPQDAVLELLERDRDFARRMLLGLALHNYRLVHDIETYTLMTSKQRVIAYLLRHCPCASGCTDRTVLTLPAAKQDIAARLNMKPETLSRILHDLSAEGLIANRDKKIFIRNRRCLHESDTELPPAAQGFSRLASMTPT
jgi:CRP/FNR family transcriptional regulator, dissimilatory nitrate respiration regulator